jgi:hypothetical protein
MTHFVLILRWHIAKAYGSRHGVPEVDTLCGRSVSMQWGPAPQGRILCKTCEKIAASYGWPT